MIFHVTHPWLESAGFLCALNAQDYQMHTKYTKGSSYTNVVNKEETTCSKCAFIALCSYQTMVIYSNMDTVIVSDHVLIWVCVY